jgi:Na+/melibiose symporter-like transporter
MRPGGLWRESDFLKLWIGQTVSQMGSWISRIALPLTAVLILGASPFQMGLLSGADAAAVLVFGLFAGAWADRLRKRPILIGADLGRLLVLGTVPLAAAWHSLNMGHLYLVAAASSILTVFFDVSYQAYLPSLVTLENILEGNSKLTLTQSLAEVVAPGLTGMLVQWITAPMAILFDAFSFLFSAMFIWLIRKPEPLPERASQPHIGREIAEGLRVSWNHPILRALLQRTATASFFMGFIGALYMIFAIRELGLSAGLLGVIISVGGAGSLGGALVSERLVHRFGVGPTLIGSAIVVGAGSLLVPMAHGSVMMCAAFLAAAQLFDVAWPVYNINELSLRQSIAPPQLLGRVNSAAHLLFRGVLPVGAMAGGILAQGIGMRLTMFAGSVGFLLSTLWLLFSPIRHLRQLPGTPDIVFDLPGPGRLSSC